MEPNINSTPAEPSRPSRKPADTAITQQRLPACTPVLDPCWVIFIFVSIGVILIPIGAICFATGIQPVEILHRYDDTCFKAASTLKTNDARKQVLWGEEAARRCTVPIEIKRKMDGPVYIWYELEGFYQNHRRYVKSRSDAQLAGLTTKTDVDCKPQQFYNNSKDYPILPCGLVAWSFFNDTFKIANRSSVVVRNSSLASRTDRRRFSDADALNFNPKENSLRGGGNLTVKLNQDERFILWMKTAALPTFRKLWGRIDKSLEPGNITFEIVNNYNTYDFNGKKSLVIGTTTWLGGSSRFLGLAYLITGATSWVLGAFYAVLLPFMGRKIGQTDNIIYPSPRS